MIKHPHIVAEYNRNIGATDLFDMLSTNPTYESFSGVFIWQLGIRGYFIKRKQEVSLMIAYYRL